MKRMLARTLLQYTTEQLIEMLTGKFILVFDDGELESTDRECIYSSYAWRFHREFPNTPMLKRHHVSQTLKGKRLNADTHLEFLGTLMWDVHDNYPNVDINVRDHLSRMVYEITNEIYCRLSLLAEDYVTSFDILDFKEILDHSAIQQIKNTVEPTSQSIEKAHEEIKKVIRTAPELDKNTLAVSTRAKLVKDNQLVQCIGPRGFVTDMDSNIFRSPIMRGFGEGLRLFHDSLIESRQAAKSLFFSKSPLQEAEYFSRRLQLICQNVMNLHRGDCGSNKYLFWNVRPKLVENGEVLYNGDLPLLVGKYYLDDETNTLKAIKETDTHLVGKTLKLRSAIHCAHTDPHGICETCFGELALSVPAGSNIGHMCCTFMTEKSTQSVLSVKHLDSSSAVDWIVLDEGAKHYLKASNDGTGYLLSDNMKGKNIQLVIPFDDARNMTDINDVDVVEELNIGRVSEMTEIGVLITKGEETTFTSLPVSIGRRHASMTYPLLKYIKSIGWDVDKDGNYLINMSGWDWEQPILTLPLKHFNMSEHKRTFQ